MSLKPKLIYFYPNEASYVAKDLLILGEKFRIIKTCIEPSKKWRLPFLMVYQKWLCLVHFRAKYIVCQFAGYHSLIPIILGNLLKIKTVIILGGSDCASFPEINYGNFRKKLLGWFTAKSIEKASILSPVHEKMIGYDYTYKNFINKRQGYSAFTEPNHALVKVIYNGFVTDVFVKNNLTREKNFVAIAAYNRDAVYTLKGIDLLEKAAIHFPECKFTVVGVADQYLENPRPSNLIYLPFVSPKDLIKILNENYFYCQLSISEGFPNALCEAMLCGCIPIVSNVCSLPDIIGEIGFVLPSHNPNLLFDLINKAMAIKDLEIKSNQARQRVIDCYSFDKRKAELQSLLI